MADNAGISEKMSQAATTVKQKADDLKVTETAYMVGSNVKSAAAVSYDFTKEKSTKLY